MHVIGASTKVIPATSGQRPSCSNSLAQPERRARPGQGFSENPAKTRSFQWLVLPEFENNSGTRQPRIGPARLHAG